MRSRLQSYIELIESFCQKKIMATEFEQEYLHQYKNDPTDWSEVEFAILDELFGTVDAFCADPHLREEGDVDEEQLREACKTALGKIRALDVMRAEEPS
jgi:hypothetical protein